MSAIRSSPFFGLIPILFIFFFFNLVPTLVESYKELKFLVALPNLPLGPNLIKDTIINVLTFTKNQFNEERILAECGEASKCVDDFILFDLVINDNVSISQTFSDALALKKEREKLIGLIGGYDALPTFSLAMKANPLKLWQCSGSVTSFDQATQLLESTLPFYFNAIHSDEEVSQYLATFLETMKWPSVSVLCQSGLYGAEMSQQFSIAAIKKDITIVTTQTFHAGSRSNMQKALENILETDHRVIVYFGDEKAFLAITEIAYKLGMVNKEWAWIGSESLAPLLYFLKEHPIEEYHRELLLTNGLMLLFPCPIPSTDLVLQLQSTYPDMNGAQLMGTHALLFRECFLSMAEGIVGISSKIQHENLISGNYNISTSDFRAFHEQNANRSEIHARFHVKGYTILNLYNGDMRPAYQLNVAEDYFEQIDFPRFHDGSSEIPYYKRRLPERYLHPHHPGVIGMLCVLALLMLSFNLVAAYLCVHRNHPSVKCTSYPFLFLITAGITLCLSSIVLLVDKPTSTTCNLRIWVFLMGLQLMLSSIAAKAYRIWLIFDNTMLARIDYLSNPYLFKGCSFILFFQAVVLLIITLTSPLEPSPIETSTAIYYRCQAKPIEIDLALRSVCVLLVAIMLTATVLLAHKTRTAATAFCETNYILYTAQNVFVCALVTVPLEFVDLKEFVLSATIIHIIMVLFGAVATFWMLVGRIAWQVYKEQRNQSGPFAPSALDSQWPLPMSLGRHPGVTMKHAAVTGMFPIKAGHRFLATWHHSNLLLFPLEGYLGILPTKQAWSKGRLFKLRTIVFEVPEKIQLCIKLIIGPSIFLIQFHNSLEFDAWMQLFRVHCNYRPDMEPTPTFLPTTASGIRYRTQTFGSYSTKYQFPWSQPKPFESTTALNFTSEQNKNVKSAQDTTSTTKGPLEKPEE